MTTRVASGESLLESKGLITIDFYYEIQELRVTLALKNKLFVTIVFMLRETIPHTDRQSQEFLGDRPDDHDIISKCL